MDTIPRPEYPRPQMVREAWVNLNGLWDFAVDDNSQKAAGFIAGEGYTQQMLVPFCPESPLSGINNKDFMSSLWYCRTIQLPQDWQGQRVLLHIGAVDYAATVWVNGHMVGTHLGGYTPFTFEISQFLVEGDNRIVIHAKEDTQSPLQPTGKQAMTPNSETWFYTRVSGIWQTVWLEKVPAVYIKSFKLYPDVAGGKLTAMVLIDGNPEGLHFRANVYASGNPVGSIRMFANNPCLFTVNLSEKHLWSPEDPFLYDLDFSIERGDDVLDSVFSYFGLRSIRIRGKAVLLNDKPVFQRLVLDQGYYPEGIYTAPTDAALRADIELGKQFGFNGARLHQKVFEPRYLYWADKLGYLVWGEYPNWGLDYSDYAVLERVLPEWTESLERDFNHPSIVGWTPFNETTEGQNPELIRNIVRMTKLIDPTRPIIDVSGWIHVEGDILDTHDYEQDPAIFASHYERLKTEDIVWEERQKIHLPYTGLPFMISEFGGIWWNPAEADNMAAWGYGNRPQSEQEFLSRYKGLVETLLFHPNIFGFCYTQLYDVEQEVNGLCAYSRAPKFDPAIIQQINSQRAAIEQQSGGVA